MTVLALSILTTPFGTLCSNLLFNHKLPASWIKGKRRAFLRPLQNGDTRALNRHLLRASGFTEPRARDMSRLGWATKLRFTAH